MRLITAIVIVISTAATSGCHFDFATKARADGILGGEDESEWDMRTPANDMGCFPDTLSETQALCLCEDLSGVGELRLLESADGEPASLGVNGDATLVGQLYVEGSLHAQQGIDAVAAGTIRDDVSTAGSFNWVGSQHVRGDLNVGRHLDGVGDMTVDGTLRVGGSTLVVGDLQAESRQAYQPLSDPCACDGDSYFSVSIAVADAAELNDNKTIDLASTIATVGDSELILPSGRYYFDSWGVVGQARIVADGNVAIFVNGSMTTVGAGQLSIADGGSLDLYVAGTVESVGAIDMGTRDDPNAFRLFIGGPDAVLVGVGEQNISGYIYAPRAAIDLVGATQIHGGLFARTLTGVGELTIVYAGGAETEQETCDEVPPESPR